MNFSDLESRSRSIVGILYVCPIVGNLQEKLEDSIFIIYLFRYHV
jgi:hypothetical protein